MIPVLQMRNISNLCVPGHTAGGQQGLDLKLGCRGSQSAHVAKPHYEQCTCGYREEPGGLCLWCPGSSRRSWCLAQPGRVAPEDHRV